MNNLEYIIDVVKNWKEQFVQDRTKEEIDPLSIGEVEDLLDGIQEGEHKCYASYLFRDLNEIEKRYIRKELEKEGIYINFEDLVSVYDTNFKK